MSLIPPFAPPKVPLSFCRIWVSPMARSISLYSSLTFVTAVYSLGTHSHTAMANSVAAMVAVMYGCSLINCTCLVSW